MRLLLLSKMEACVSRNATDYRDRANDAKARSKTAHSHEEGYLQLKRQKALNALADTEDWLNGEKWERSQLSLLPSLKNSGDGAPPRCNASRDTALGK
jgi:hypothetical protein